MGQNILCIFVVDHEYQCVCQVYCQEITRNYWKVIFAFVSSRDHLEVITMSTLSL